MKKEFSIILLPTDKESRIYIETMGELVYLDETYLTEGKTNQHLYILSDEEIEEGEWCLDTIKNKIVKANSVLISDLFKKIIASTDPSLNLLPISDSFIKEYVKAHNEGKKIDVVELEVETGYPPFDCIKGLKLSSDGSVIASLKEERSVNELIDALTVAKDECDRAHKELDKIAGFQNRKEDEFDACDDQQILEYSKLKYKNWYTDYHENEKRLSFLSGCEWMRNHLKEEKIYSKNDVIGILTKFGIDTDVSLSVKDWVEDYL